MKITVVTVTYNCAEMLQATINSVTSQTYDNIEYIIVDGASTDGTVDIIKANNDKISKWISEPDNGIYDAMNKGIAYATGEWVNFMNSGDTFASNDVLENVFSRNLTGVDILYGNVRKFYSSKSKVIIPTSIDSIMRHLPFCHQSSFTRRNLLNCKFDLSYRFVSDDDFFYKQYRKGSTFLHVNIIISNYESLCGFSSSHMKDALWENYIIRNGTNYHYWYFFVYLPIKIKHNLFLLINRLVYES